VTTAAQRKGDKFEVLVRGYLRAAGLPVERIPSGMREDRGDLGGIEDFTFQLKSYTDTTRAVRDGLADLEVQQANADTKYGVVIYKRRGKTDPGSQLVTFELWQLAALLLELRNGRRAGG